MFTSYSNGVPEMPFGTGCPACVGTVGTPFGVGSVPGVLGSTSGSGTVICGSCGRFTLGRLGTAGAMVCTTYGVGTGSGGSAAATVLTTWLATATGRPAWGTIRYVYSMVP